MSLDPRVLSTPIGLVVGLAITRKLLRPEDRTFRNQLIGTGIGGTAGLITGQLARGEQLSLAKKSDRRYRRFIRETLPVGDPEGGEIDMLQASMQGDLFPNIPSDYNEGGPIQKLKTNFISRSWKSLIAQKVHAARVQELQRVVASNPKIPQHRKIKVLEAINRNESLMKQHGSRVTRQALAFGLPASIWNTMTGGRE